MTAPPNSPSADQDPLIAALAEVVVGDRSRAHELARVAAAAMPAARLPHALERFLAGSDGEMVYEHPAAFEAFIRHGGNVELYRAVSQTLALRYADWSVRTLLDIGCGDGLAVEPAVARTAAAIARLDLVEPSAALLEAALDGLTTNASAGTVCTWPMTVQQFVETEPDATWSLIESTFALHTLAPVERRETLSSLVSRTERLAIVEFDVRSPDAGRPAGPPTTDQLRWLAERYEQGLAEYYAESGELGDLVAQGFLIPVLVGQLDPGARRNTWEGPADEWSRLVGASGYTDVQITPLIDYWWSPAFLLTASGGRSVDAVGG